MIHEPPNENRYARAVCKGKSSCAAKGKVTPALTPASAGKASPSQENAPSLVAAGGTSTAAARRLSSGEDSRRTSSLERGKEELGEGATARVDGKGEGAGRSSWRDRLMAVQRQRAVLEETMRAARERLLEKTAEKEVWKLLVMYDTYILCSA